MGKTALLVLEFAVIFIVFPPLIYYRLIPNLPIPYLVALSLMAWLVLRHDPLFDSSHLVNPAGALRNLRPVLLRSAVLCGVLGLAVWCFAPDLLFSLIDKTPAFWALVMVAYPLLSVYPQEVIFRAYFFHRYQTLFGSGWMMVVASALAFGFVHIALGNWIAMILSAVGGVLFGLTYRQSGSLLLASIEHAFFGNFIFTIGLGQFFYHGARLRLG